LNLAENMVVAGRFRLNRLLGRGGMGSIWHATHLGLDIPCALKFIEGHLAEMADMNARFEREAKAAAKLRSPHVVQILDHGIWEGIPYIAMELLEGEDLGKRLERVGKLPPSEVVAIIDQVTRALGKAHGMGIVHRDLKPDNIFLVKDDDREIAKVLDFGIAKTSVELASGATKTGAMLGTPYYMSPEQAQGIKAVDLRADLWSLAVIAYECVTGARPFESEALGDLLMRIIIAPLPVPSQVAQVPPGFDAWWSRAAKREPSERFQTAKDLAEGLALALGVTANRLTTEPRVAPPMTASPVGSAAQARSTTGTAGAAPSPGPSTMKEEPLPLVVRTKLAATTGAAVAHTHSEASPVPTVKRSRAGLYGVGIAAFVGAAAIFAFVRLRSPADTSNPSAAISSIPTSTEVAATVPTPVAAPAPVPVPEPPPAPAAPPSAQPIEPPARAPHASAHDAGAASPLHGAQPAASAEHAHEAAPAARLPQAPAAANKPEMGF
jgi:serine/threonine protein kinase